MVGNIKCVLNICRANRDAGRILFRFPQDEVQREIWIRSCGLSSTRVRKNIYICDNHFAEDCIRNRKLVKGSIPTLNFPLNTNNRRSHYSKYIRCIIPHCQQTKQSSTETKLFQFPKKNSALYSKWIDLCNLPEHLEKKSSKFLCSNHFKLNDVNLQRPKKNACPSLNLDGGLWFANKKRTEIEKKYTKMRKRFLPVNTISILLLYLFICICFEQVK